MPEHANQTPPVGVRVGGTAPDVPQLEPPVKIVMPPLSFSAASPNPPVDTNPQLVTLVRDARVTSDWVFKGIVAPRAPATPRNAQAAKQTAAAPPKRRRGIMAMFKRFFGNSPPPPSE
jgi:hypothetical protein